MPYSFFPSASSLIWIANSFRIAALIAVGTWISPEVAEGGFHSAAGWLMFCIITLGLVAVSRQSGWFAIDQGHSKGSFRTPEGAYLLPLLFLIATGLVSGLFSTDFDYLYPLRVLTPLIPLWLFRSYYTELRWSWSWTPILLGFVVFVLWVALEPPPDPEAVDANPQRPRRNARGDGSVLADCSSPRVGGRGTSGRGARLSRLPLAPVDRCRLHSGVTEAIHRNLFPHLVGSLWNASWSLVRRHPRRDDLRGGAVPARRDLGRYRRARRYQRAYSPPTS